MQQREVLLSSWQRDHSSLRYVQAHQSRQPDSAGDPTGLSRRPGAAQKGQGFPQEEGILLSLG